MKLTKLLLLAGGGYILYKMLGKKNGLAVPIAVPLMDVPERDPMVHGKGGGIEDAWLAWQAENPGGTRAEFAEEMLVMR